MVAVEAIITIVKILVVVEITEEEVLEEIITEAHLVVIEITEAVEAIIEIVIIEILRNDNTSYLWDLPKPKWEAIDYYNKSIKKKTNDTYLVASNYRNLADIYFNKAKYVTAGKYYDSTLTVLNSKLREFKLITKKRENLEDVIKFEGIAQRNDSILKIATLSKEGKEKYYKDYIALLKKEDAKKAAAEAKEKAEAVAKADAEVKAAARLKADQEALAEITILYTNNNWDLTAESMVKLQGVVTALTARPEINIRIDGHSDSYGTSKNNIKASRNRAQGAAKFLVKNGIAASRLQVNAYGEDKPIASNKTKAGMAQNRRIEIRIIK